MNKKKKGFTLIELMIVIAIIAILAAILVPNFLRARNQGNLTACKSNLKNLGTAMEMYATDNSGSYALSIAALSSAYLQTIPSCPLGNSTYTYTTNTTPPTNYTASCGAASPAHSGIGGCTSTTGQPYYNSASGLNPR